MKTRTVDIRIRIEGKRGYSPKPWLVFSERRWRWISLLFAVGFVLVPLAVIGAVANWSSAGYLWMAAFSCLGLEQIIETAGWRKAYRDASYTVALLAEGQIRGNRLDEVSGEIEQKAVDDAG